VTARGPSDDTYVLRDLDEAGVLTLTLNRPDVLNAWIPLMQTALFDAMDTATEDSRVRVIVLTGAGRGFCPGADMQYLASLAEGSQTPSGTGADTRPITYAMSVPKPVVCAINGACAGIGLAVAMSCDIRFAAAEAKLTTAFSKLGLVAEHGLSWTLPQACGYATARELLLTARRFTGEEAAALGVVHGALPLDELLHHTRTFARQLARQSSPVSFAAMKWQLARTPLQTAGDALREANRLMSQTTQGPDFAEGVKAFTGRRDPSFAPLGHGTIVEYPASLAAS
jgi:enoyl-CoA hydratase/carnithine racemase